jgi:DNA-binding Lrp family transcriptional regulator
MQQAEFIRAATILFAAMPDRRLSHLDRTILGLLLRTEGPPLRRADIAEIADCHPNSVSRSAKKLADLGYLARETRREEGNRPTRYALPEVTTPCNPEVTSNTGVTSLVTAEIRPNREVVTGDRDTISSRNPEVTSLVTSSPHTPLNNTNSNLGDSSSTTELELTGGVGDGPDRAPRKKRENRKREAVYVATEAGFPVEPSALWCEMAAAAGMINGTVTHEWSRYRNWHLDHGKSVISPRVSIGNWLTRWAQGGAQQHHELKSRTFIDAQGRRCRNAKHNPIY